MNLRRLHRRARAFTLLEVILALAILAGSIAMLTEGVRGARRNGQIAAKLTVAQLLATGKMAELAAQVTPLSGVTEVPCETEPEYAYSIVLGTTPVAGLVSVTVTVGTQVPGVSQPVTYSLVRWMTDPGVAQSEQAEADAATSETSGDSSTTATGSGNGR